MLFNRQQLAMSLCQLVETDYELLNDIIISYVNNLNDNISPQMCTQFDTHKTCTVLYTYRSHFVLAR